MILQVDLYDGNTFRHILVLRRLFAADEGNVIFLEGGDSLEDSTAQSGSLLKSICKLCDPFVADVGSLLTPYQTIFLIIDSDAIAK